MSNKSIKLFVVAVCTLLAGILFTACQQSVQNTPSQSPTSDRRNVTKIPPVEPVYPTLQVSHKNPADANIPAATSDFKLKGQVSHYTSSSKSSLEIILTDSTNETCENRTPELQDGQSIIKITVKSKDGKALTIGNYSADKYDMSATMSTKSGTNTNEVKCEGSQIPTFKMTDLNAAIARGNFNIVGTDTGLQGEFFTAICK